MIGHASIDENRKIKGGKAGDQTGKEVCTRSWYSNSWHTLIRAKDKNIALKMAMYCQAICNNPNVGYDQNERNSLRYQLQQVNWNVSKIAPCECDCSSLMAVCAEAAGVPFSYRNAPATSNMVKAFSDTKMFDIYTDIKYLTSDKYLMTGDILVKNGHTVMVLTDGKGVEPLTVFNTYKVGQTYTTTTILNVRVAPGVDAAIVPYSQMTKSGKEHSYPNAETGGALLKKNTRVTCQQVKDVKGDIWIKIPSRWICAIYKGKVYVG